MQNELKDFVTRTLTTYIEINHKNDNFFEQSTLYRCLADDLIVVSRGEVIDRIHGNHIENFTNSDVNWLTITKSDVSYLPTGIENFFEKITFLVISGIGLMELTMKDLEQFPALKFIWAPNNKFVSLESDLFSQHPDIFVMDFSNNNLKYLDRKALIKPSTVVANFQNNECVDFEFDNSRKYSVTGFSKTCLFPDEIYCEYKQMNKRAYEAKILDGMEYEGVRKVRIRYWSNKKHELLKMNQATKKLEAKFLNFTKIPQVVCEEFINLEKLEITGSLISKISKNELQNFQRLKVLKMSSNKIRIVTSDTFLYNKDLETIDLSNNKIKAIGVSTFSGLKNLKNLLLRNANCISGSGRGNYSKVESFISKINEKCGLDDVITCKFSTSNYRYIGSAYSCNIISRKLVESQQSSKFNKPYQNDNFSKLTSLEKYNGVQGKHLDGKTNLDVEVLSIQHGNSRFLNTFLSSYVPNLKTVRIMDSNLLYLFEDTFDGLMNLTVVDMSHNQLTEIPKKIFAQNTNLIFVDFSYNNIKRLPLDIFSDLIHIKVIRLLNNPCIDSKDKDIDIDLLPSVINKCDLREIELICNEAKKLVKFCTVKSIDQTSYFLPIVKVHNIVDYDIIEEFTIDYAAIEYLPTNLSNFFPNLEKYSAYGIIKGIFKENFENLVHLTKVDLTGNRIETIDENVFHDNENLEEIYLSFNRIKSIPPNTFAHLKNIYHLELKENACANVYLQITMLEEFDSEVSNTEVICGAKLPKAYMNVNKSYRDEMYRLVFNERARHGSQIMSENVRSRYIP